MQLNAEVLQGGINAVIHLDFRLDQEVELEWLYNAILEASKGNDLLLTAEFCKPIERQLRDLIISKRAEGVLTRI
jgi:hypothetical protein